MEIRLLKFDFIFFMILLSKSQNKNQNQINDKITKSYATSAKSYAWGSGKRAEKKQIQIFELSTYSRSLEQAEYHTF